MYTRSTVQTVHCIHSTLYTQCTVRTVYCTHSTLYTQDYTLYIIQIAIAVVSALRDLYLSITCGLEQLAPANRASVQRSSPGESSHSVGCSNIEAISAPYSLGAIGGCRALYCGQGGARLQCVTRYTGYTDTQCHGGISLACIKQPSFCSGQK